MPTASASARWTYGDVNTHYAWAQCRYCGKAQERDCTAVDCPACGSRQCHSNGSGNGTCQVCHYGWLPGWSRSAYDRECGYRGCSAPAVANAPRVKRVCAAHLDRAKVNGVTLAAYIAGRVAHRDSGKGWEHFRWTV